MNQNLGKLDRIFRFVLGIWLIKDPDDLLAFASLDWGTRLILIIGLIALLESFAGWCWLHKALGLKEHWQ